MKRLIMLTDYKGFFWSKEGSFPYQGGMDVPKLRGLFARRNFCLEVIPLAQVDFRGTDFHGVPILYQSAEDRDLHYKSFIEDILYGIVLRGGELIPGFPYLKAHHDKVFMEILRDILPIPEIKNIHSRFYGTLEEFIQDPDPITPDAVMKTFAGAMSTGVGCGRDRAGQERFIRTISRTFHPWDWFKEWVRTWLYKGYVRNSWHRRRFITQNLIPGLDADWKVLVYGKRVFALRRSVRKGDFRASGSGLFSFIEDLPAGMLDFAENILRKMDLPCVSLDLAQAGDEFYLLEFQALHFGTKTLVKSPFHFLRSGTDWEMIRQSSDLEEVFVEAVAEYLDRRQSSPPPPTPLSPHR